MSRWTPDHSMLLSLLLDTVVGTKEMIEIRKDYCRIYDCLYLANTQISRCFFTGSKSEGLDLPGSDEDFMYDINNMVNMKVTQSLDERIGLSPCSTFFLCTENVLPGFALLQNLHQTPIHRLIYRSLQYRNGMQYLSSNLIIQNFIKFYISKISAAETVKRQGPSAEVWTRFQDKSESGLDQVLSIHCTFWPIDASEWVQRPRRFGWPTSIDINTITDFGFHLVPVGHPRSETKLMEWRISFSLAERTLVWSFNQVQMQCYAVMKIILKEFIKVRCNPDNQVLCSYFIKTFLFWRYEETELNFWHENRFRECLKYLLDEFCKCVREGVLRHYFIPRFNLLSVKLTRAARENCCNCLTSSFRVISIF